jgi:hypothetical protein
VELGVKFWRERMTNFEDIQGVKREHAFSLLCRAGVVGVGIGKKEVGGKATEVTSITILVEKKVRGSLLPVEDRLPSELDGIPTDVVSIVGDDTFMKVRLRQSPLPGDNRTKRWRPAPGGVSVGHYLLQGAGTLGAWVADSISGEPLLLSCWHVIANMGHCRKGDSVLQPAVLDGGKLPDDTIAYLDRWVDVGMIVPTQNLSDARRKLRELLELKSQVPINKVDAAVARPISDAVVSHEIIGIGNIGLAEGSAEEVLPEIGMRVVKSGKATGVTHGKINIVDLDIFVRYPPIGIALFADQGD